MRGLGVSADARMFEEDTTWDDNPTFDIQEMVNLIAGLSNSYLVFNPTRSSDYLDEKYATYNFVKAKPLTVQTPVTSVALDNKILIEQGYQYEKINVGYTINLKYKYKVGTATYSGSILRSGFGGSSGSVIDIDISNYVITQGIADYEDLLNKSNSILEQYKAMYARVSGILTIDAPMEDTDLIVGNWYSITDAEQFNFLLDNNYSVYLYMVKQDNDTCTFFVLQTEKTAYVGMALPAYRVSGEDYKLRIPAAYVQQFNGAYPPLFEMDDSFWAHRAIAEEGASDVRWDTTADWYIILMPTMEILASGINITNVSLPAGDYEDMILTVDTDISSISALFPLLFKYKENQHVTEFYITKDSGV